MEELKKVTHFEALDLEKLYSYADYLTWEFEERLEIIKGKIFMMSPAPFRRHQRVSGNLYGYLFQALQGNSCQLYDAPFDVRLPSPSKNKVSKLSNESIYTVVQPDLCIICDPSKLDERGCIGAPDLIVEILSPSTRKKDLLLKKSLYEETGVLEYWIIYPNENHLEAYILGETGRYELKGIYGDNETLETSHPKGLLINLHDVFAENF